MTSSETTAAGSPSSTPTTAAPASPVTASPLRVRPPGSSPSSSPTPSPTTASGAGSGTGFDPVDSDSGSTRSSSVPPAGAVKVDTKSLAEVARAAVLTASRYVHAALAKPEDEAEADLWIARDKDQAQIGDPLASVLGRRGLAGGAVNPDVANLIEAGIGLLAYVAYHAGEAWRIRSARRKLARVGPTAVDHQTGEPL